MLLINLHKAALFPKLFEFILLSETLVECRQEALARCEILETEQSVKCKIKNWGLTA